MAVRDAGVREDQFVVRVTLDGVAMGVWDNKSGGDLDSDSTTYYPGNMGTQQDLGGRKTASNLTLQRLYDRFDDHDKINTWWAAVGKGQLTVSQRPLDDNDNEYGKALVWAGRLKRVAAPPHDSNSGSAAILEIEMTVKGAPVAI